MQLNDNTILPYPCLNINIFDEEEPSIDFKITHRNMMQTSFYVNVKTTNKDLISLIDNGKACYCLEMDCSKAFFREAIVQKSGNFNVTLYNNRMNGQLQCTLSVVAVKEITGYRNSAFDIFYRQFSINIGEGETLAYLGNFKIDMIEKSTEVKSLADDFIEVTCDENLTYSRFELGEEKIVLKLPEEMFQQYHNPRICENQDCEAFLHASFLLNVLTSALQNIRDYSERRWAITLRKRIETEDELRKIVTGDDDSDDGNIFEEDGSLVNPDAALDLAQCILGNPYERMFKSFDNINNREDD